MIKKFAKGTLIYAGSALLFSVSRQLVFFPVIQKYFPQHFARISFLLVTIDFLIYTFGSTLADYYVRAVTKDNQQKGLFKFLCKLSFLAILSSVVFFIQDFEVHQAFILGLYMVLFSLNTIQLKVYFNNLNFVKNYIYIFLRLIPYALLLLVLTFFQINDITAFISMLLIFEALASINLYLGNVSNGFRLSEINQRVDLSIFKFFVIYTSFALVQRIDMFYVEYFFEDKYVEYYQIISVFLIGVNPIILLTSSSLLSMLTIVDFQKFLKVKNKISMIILVAGLLVAGVFLIISPYLLDILYPENKLLEDIPWVSFMVVFFSILFFVSKTFLIKYVNLNHMFALNMLIALLPLIFFKNFNYFITAFFFSRGLGYLTFLLGIKEVKHVDGTD